VARSDREVVAEESLRLAPAHQAADAVEELPPRGHVAGARAAAPRSRTG
jgi:hypothetical protein